MKLNTIKHKMRLKDEIYTALLQPKANVYKLLESYDAYVFEAYQALWHLLPPNDGFYKMYDGMFILYVIDEMRQKQICDIEAFTVMIYKEEPEISVTIENDIDFSFIPKFTYISKNIIPKNLVDDTHKTQNELTSEQSKTGHFNDDNFKQPPLVLFKTMNRGWRIKAFVAIPEGKVLRLLKRMLIV